MKRPLLLIGFTYLGVTALSFLWLPPHPLLFCMAVGALGMVLGISRKSSKTKTTAIFLLTASVALAASVRYNQRVAMPFQSLQKQTLAVEGLITGIQDYSTSHYYTIKARFPDHPGLPQNRTIRLVGREAQSCEEGDLIRCLVFFPEKELSTNSRSQEILAQGYIQGEMERTAGSQYRVTRGFLDLRDRMSDNVRRRVGTHWEMVSAMSLALRQELDSQVNRNLRSTGISHLLSLSGLHLSILTGMVRKLLARTPVPKRLANVFSIAFVLLFAALVGFSPSLTRSVVMSIMTLLGEIISRRNDSLNALGLACLLICIFSPQWALGIGLWLSVTSTLGILLFSQPLDAWMFRQAGGGGKLRTKVAKWIIPPLSMTLSAYICSAPVLLLGFGSIPLISPIANLASGPLVPIIIGGGLLLGAVPMGTPLEPLLGLLGKLVSLAAGMTNQVAETLARHHLGSLTLGDSWTGIWFAGAVVLAVVAWRQKWSGNILRYGTASMLALAMVFSFVTMAGEKCRAEVISFDGGNSILLLREGRAVIVGVPDSFSAYHLLSYMEYRNVKGVDAVIATDPNQRITGGLLDLTQAYSTACLLGPDNGLTLRQLEQATKVPAVPLGESATVLGGIKVIPGEEACEISLGGYSVLKVDRECDIMVHDRDNQAVLFADGILVFPHHMKGGYRLLQNDRYAQYRLVIPI